MREDDAAARCQINIGNPNDGPKFQHRRYRGWLGNRYVRILIFVLLLGFAAFAPAFLIVATNAS